MRVVTVGHVTNDHLSTGVHAGGAALYAGLAARALGCDVTLVTRAGEDFVGKALLERFQHVQRLSTAHTTAFDERYVGARRRVRLRSEAERIDTFIPEADVVLLCPVAGEVPASLLALRPARLLAAGLQGWLRAYSEDGEARPRPLENSQAFAGCGLVSCSAEDLEGLGPETLAELRRTVPCVAVTDAGEGARVYAGDRGWSVPPLAVESLDPTGAGDVFLATLAIRLASGDSLLDAARWAVCAGAVAVTGLGAAAVLQPGALVEAWTRYRQEASPPRKLRADG